MVSDAFWVEKCAAGDENNLYFSVKQVANL